MFHNISTTLYHGSISVIQKVDVSMRRGRKDFGKGFYMSVSKQQAIGMMHKKYKEAKRKYFNMDKDNFEEVLYKVELDESKLSSLNIKIFEYADVEWLDFILMCRNSNDMPHDYDLVIGPTADDDTIYCLKRYYDGDYGEKNSIEAKRMLLRNLEVENLGIQYFIGKQDVADKLIHSLIPVERS